MTVGGTPMQFDFIYILVVITTDTTYKRPTHQLMNVVINVLWEEYPKIPLWTAN